MAISSEYSLADIAAATGNDRNNSGMWGGDWSAWIIIFLMNDRRMYGADYSMARRHDSRGRYSRGDAKEHMLDKLGEMMPMADDRQRDILENAMHQLENA